jgi:ABC-2 type transport system permease protein
MRNLLAVVGKELKQSFGNPASYFTLAIFSFLSGFIFLRLINDFGQDVEHQRQAQLGWLRPLHFTDQVLSPLMLGAAILLMMVIPVLTARTLAAERRDQTLQFLMTAPITPFQIVMGKYLACLFLVLVMTLVVLIYPLLLALLAQEGAVEWRLVFTGWLGLWLAGAAFTAVGLFVSSLTKSPLLACLISWALLLWLWVVGWAASGRSGVNPDVLMALSSMEHLRSFCKGLLDAKDLAYYLTMTGLGLFLTHQSLETTRWR